LLRSTRQTAPDPCLAETETKSCLSKNRRHRNSQLHAQMECIRARGKPMRKAFPTPHTDGGPTQARDPGRVLHKNKKPKKQKKNKHRKTQEKQFTTKKTNTNNKKKKQIHSPGAEKRRRPKPASFINTQFKSRPKPLQASSNVAAKSRQSYHTLEHAQPANSPGKLIDCQPGVGKVKSRAWEKA